MRTVVSALVGMAFVPHDYGRSIMQVRGGMS